MFKTLIADKSYWVGKVDDRKVPFHRLTLEKGTTYNSYLLETEKPTLIDTVDISFGVEFVKNLEKVFNLEKLQYVVINHVEPDHAGALPALMNKAKNAVIVTTEKARKFLNGMFKLHNREYLIIKDGDTLDIGGKTLQFFEVPFLHTEETMMTYAVEDKILYPCDIFSTHIANYELFNDIAKEDMVEDFKVYYSLIMHPHRPFVRDLIEKLRNIEIEMIAPSHGYILRKDVQSFIELYDSMSFIENDVPKKALVLFSSMTGNTGKVAQNISRGLNDLKVETTVVNVKNADIESLKEMVKEHDAVIVGSSTRYGDMIGNIEDFLKEIVTMNLSNKYGAAFGSFGWSGESIEIINDYLKNSNIKLIDTSYLIKATGDESIHLPLRINFYDEKESAEASVNAGRALAEVIYK
jgi:flavorubredoxin